jgi:hypothetical protein
MLPFLISDAYPFPDDDRFVFAIGTAHHLD